MKRLLKILGWILLFLIFLSSGIAGLAWWKKESILRVMVDELNKNLMVPVEVSQMELSLDHFPSVAIRFHQVFIADPKQKGDTLLYVEKLDAASNLRNWLGGNYRINNLYAHTGKVEIRQYEDESWNYDWVYEQSSEGSSRNVELKGLRADEIRLYYFQPKEKRKLLTFLKSIDLQGNLTGLEEIRLNAEHSLFRLNLDDKNIETSKGELKLVQDQGLWSGHWSHAFGELSFTEEEKRWNFSGQTENILRVASWINAEIPKDLVSLEGSWQAKGIWLKSTNEAEVEWSGKKLNLGWKAYPKIQMELSGIWQMNEDSTYLDLKKAEAKSDEIALSSIGHFRLDSKKIGNFQAKLSIQDLKQLATYADSLPPNLDGRLNASFNYRGVLEKAAIQKSLLAEMDLDGVGFDYEGMEIRNAKGKLSNKGDDWKIENLLLLINQQEVFANGKISWPKVEDQVPSAQLKIRMASLDLSKWTNGSKTEAFKLPNFEMDVVLDADEFRMSNLRLSQVKLSFKSNNSSVKVDKLFAEGLGGELRGQLDFFKEGMDYRLQSVCELENISIDALFKAFNNFGQEVLTSDHLKGRLSSHFDLQMEMDEKAQINLDKLQVNGTLKLMNAELIGFAPLEALSVFAQREELNHLRMTEHIQPIEIHDGAVWLPLTTIKTNAFELKIRGEHRFNNWIDYTVQMPIEALIRKGKKSKGEFDDWIVEVQERQQPGIYVQLIGDMKDPKIQWDKNATQEGLRQEWKENANPFRRDTTTTPKNPTGGIQFEWEEDGG